MHFKKGISLIVLVITIIIMSILLSVIILDIDDRNISKGASELKIKNDVEAFKEELRNYISHQEHVYISEGKSYDSDLLYADEDSVKYNDTPIKDINNIYDILPSLKKDDYKGSFKIENGKLVFEESDEDDFNDEETTWINEVLQ